MAVNRVLNGKKQLLLDYIFAVMITGCAMVFGLLMEETDAHSIQKNTFLGVIMMLAFLGFDALTSNAEKRIFDDYPEINSSQMLVAMSFFSLIYSLIAVEVTVGILYMCHFFAENYDAFIHVIGLSCCSMVGQYLALYVIREHGPVCFSIMMTVRQILSLIISAWLFNHAMSTGADIFAVGAFALLLVKYSIKHVAYPKYGVTAKDYTSGDGEQWLGDHLPGPNSSSKLLVPQAPGSPASDGGENDTASTIADDTAVSDIASSSNWSDGPEAKTASGRV